jgi:hypothetical protein
MSSSVTRKLHRRPWSAAAAAVIVSVGLAACGGAGGGDDGDGPPGSIDIGTGKRLPVTRAMMVSAMGGGVGGSLGLAADGGSASLAALPRPLLAALRGGASLREPRAGLIGPQQVPCDVSGSVTFTLDDRDDNQQPSVGDVLNATFAACSDVADESIDGSMSATYTQIVLSPLTVGASVATTRLTMVDGARSAQLDGGFAFTLTEASASVATLNMVVSDSLSMRVTTPVYTDTITLQHGYTIAMTEDLSAVPSGGGTPGRTTTTVSGKLASSAAGGTVQVSTNASDPLVQYSDDDYPRSGTIEALGKNGWAVATVLSTTQVRIDIDSTGDGNVDATVTLPWTDLL